MNEVVETLKKIEEKYKLFQQQQFTFIRALERTREEAHDMIRPVSSIVQVQSPQHQELPAVATGTARGWRAPGAAQRFLLEGRWTRSAKQEGAVLQGPPLLQLHRQAHPQHVRVPVQRAALPVPEDGDGARWGQRHQRPFGEVQIAPERQQRPHCPSSHVPPRCCEPPEPGGSAASLWRGGERAAHRPGQHEGLGHTLQAESPLYCESWMCQVQEGDTHFPNST